MIIIGRDEWSARPPRNRATVTWRDRSEFVVHYSEGPTTQSVRSIQDFHMDGRGWSDIGYNFLVDVQGRVYEGRGWLTIGAHAPGHNESGIGVCMIGRNGDATPAAMRSIRALYDDASRRAGRSLDKLGHRDVYATSCPGDQLYAWVRAGMPVDDLQEDEMPDYVSVGMTDPQVLPPGEWVTVTWGKEYDDSSHHHWNQGGPSVIIGPARYALTANVRVEGLPVGTDLQARVIEHAEKGDDYKPGPIAEYLATSGATFVHYNIAADTVSKGYRARLQVIQYGTQPGRIVSGYLKGLAWRV